ncbi:hypothetical protein FRC06_011069, partial [Ceratobasidium sp. 370]
PTAAVPYPPQNSPPDYSVPPSQLPILTLTVADRKAWASSLWDQAAYDKMLADVRQECAKYGRVESLQITWPPQDPENGDQVHGLDRIYITFESGEAAGRALKAFQSGGLLGHQVF